MTQDEIIEMVQEAGFSGSVAKMWSVYFEALIKLATVKEREACTRIVEVEAMQYAEPVWAYEIVNDIRARGEE